MPDKATNKIEDIKRHLYDREDTTTNRRREGTLHPINYDVSSTWEADAKKEDTSSDFMLKKPPTSIFKKFFIGAIIFFLAAMAFASYMFLRGGVSVSNDNIDIVVLGNAFTKGGEELPLQVEVVNRNNANLELANLIIEYPRGASDNTTDVIRLPRESIGTIKAGQSITRNIKVTLFGDEESVRNVKFSFEYHPEGSNAIFTKEKEYGVTISSAPLSLSINAPDTATSGQPISFTVTATLNTSLPKGDTMLQLTYPSGFVFDSATPAPVFGNSVWGLSTLSATAPVSIMVRGKLIGQDGDEQVFHAYAGTTNPNDSSVVSVVYNSLLKTMKITKPFLETHILVNSQDLDTYTAGSDEKVNASVSWTNNLPTRITDAKIILKISGNAFDRTTIDPLEGFYDSANSQIVWDKNSISDLGSLEPGARGTVSFSFKSIPLVGLSTAVKDPQIALDVSIRGTQPSEGSTFSNVDNFSKKIIKIMSDFQIASSAVFASGPMPPKAESETRYTVTWTLSNSANNISSAVARAALPVYVDWVGAVSSGSENISYNSVTREVIWNIGSVRPNTGISSNREASFTIALKPSLSQVGSVPQLMKDISLTGQDSFTRTIVKSSRGPITTMLMNDPNFKHGDERVVN